MDWNIKKGGEVCLRCEQLIDPGATYYSTLVVDEAAIERSDFCETCFTQESDDDKRVFWRTSKSCNEPVKKAVNFEWVRELFERMLEVKEKAFKEMAYLLALVLIRKRYLKLKDFVSRNGQDFMEVRRKKGEPLLHVEVPMITEQDISILRDKLSDLLEADLEGDLDLGTLRDKLNSEPEPPAPAEEIQPSD